MKLRFDRTNSELEMIQGKMSFLTIENPVIYDEFYTCIALKSSGKTAGISIIKENEELDFSKIVFPVASPSDISLDSSSIRKRLYQELASVAHDDELCQRLSSLYQEAIALTEEIAVKANYNIDFDTDFESKELFSSLKVALREETGRFAERLIHYIDVTQSLFGKPIYIVINCDGFLSTSDYDEISKEVAYRNIVLLFVSSRQIQWSSKETETIIDSDLCII